MRLFSAKGGRYLSASVALYALLSAAPLFVVILSVVGSVFGRARAESALWDGLSMWVAPEGLAAIRHITERLDGIEHSGNFVGVLLVIYGSTRMFGALRHALNQLWGIDTAHASHPKPMKRIGVRYGIALSLTLFAAVLVALLIVVKAGIAMVASVTPAPPPAVWWALDALVSVALTFLLFLAAFRMLPETEVTWREAITSAGVSTLLFALGSSLVTLYLRHKQVGDLYEGASAVVLAVLWVYYSAQVFFFGACVSATLHERAGK
ncbi:MAG TPA: YihY/virulence factor BrkB family protein [Polyangiales bacterium]|jgi:membrane protein|nr:YihY/virulence factor BrkB family protein [Polyangiales bacterium]